MNNRFLIAAATVALLGAGFAHAGFLLESKAAPNTAGGPRLVDKSAKLGSVTKGNRQKIDLESRVTARITQSGSPPAELPMLVGVGRGVSFEDALRQILPAGFTAYSDQDMDLDLKVDWQGSRSWPLVLHTVLASRDMRAHIDWDEMEVMFFVPQAREESVAVITRAEGDARPAKKAGTKEQILELSPERSLRENLRIWANQAGWTLVWNATVGNKVVDYPVDTLVEFKGDAVGINGAMARVISAYSDAEYPLEIEFFRGNQVIEVRVHRPEEAKPTPTVRKAPGGVISIQN